MGNLNLRRGATCSLELTQSNSVKDDNLTKACVLVAGRQPSPQALKEGNPIRGASLALSRLSSILLVSLMVFSTHALCAQRTSIPRESGVQLPDAPSQVAMGSEGHLTYEGLPLSLTRNQGQTESSMRFFPDHTGYDHRLINTNAVLNQETGTAEVLSKNKYFLGSAPTKWMAFVPAFGYVHHETIHGAKDMEYYGHRIPWAGSVFLRIGQQAKAHPHIANVLKTVHPKF